MEATAHPAADSGRCDPRGTRTPRPSPQETKTNDEEKPGPGMRSGGPGSKRYATLSHRDVIGGRNIHTKKRTHVHVDPGQNLDPGFRGGALDQRRLGPLGRKQ